MPAFVSPSGLVIPKPTIPVADATGKDVSASGLVTAADYIHALIVGRPWQR